MKPAHITTDVLPPTPAYTQAIKIGNVVLLSGIVGVDADTGVAGDTVEEQVDQAIRNCQAILAKVGASLDQVVRVLVLLKDSNDFDAMNRAYIRHFPKNPPTRAVARFGVEIRNVLVSLVMTAWIGDEPTAADAMLLSAD